MTENNFHKPIISIDIDWLQTWFDTFNQRYFNNVLPPPRFTLSKSRTRLGSMSCKKKRTWLKTVSTDFTISISIFYDQTERQYQNVLLHEMIHYYIAYQNIKDTSAHGVVFKKMMKQLNLHDGWEITVSTKMAGIHSAHPSLQPSNRLVLALEMSKQGFFLSVVNPKYAHQIHANLKAIPEVKHFDWYKSDNRYFEHMPSVRSLRGRKVSKDQFDELVAEMTPVHI